MMNLQAAVVVVVADVSARMIVIVSQSGLAVWNEFCGMNSGGSGGSDGVWCRDAIKSKSRDYFA